MENQPSGRRTHEEACQRVAARFGSHWLRHYVASKLRSDPVFLEGHKILRESPEEILDVGCGVGLLPFYLRERGFAQRITGLDIDARKIRKGAEVADGSYPGVRLIQHDVVTQELPAFRGNVVLFDLLHYLPFAAQQTLLRKIASCVPTGGLFLIRDAPHDNSARFWMTYLAEIFAQTITWNVGAPLHFPEAASIHSAFSKDEWARREQPAWGRTPFNNRLFIFQRHPAAAAPAAE